MPPRVIGVRSLISWLAFVAFSAATTKKYKKNTVISYDYFTALIPRRRGMQCAAACLFVSAFSPEMKKAY